ncbi:MAG TPA: radical SAM protein [Pyrinomonadaceae bacterium]|nr:radical SAM protein [Pyrinomonadaceae bacterium]
MKIGFIVKVSKLCNLRCTYCYETPELANRERMSLENIERLFVHIREYLEDWGADSEPHELGFVWHGGEPFAQPVDYWESILALQRSVFGEEFQRSSLINTIQSNLTLLKEKHLPLLRHFELGFSFDVINDLRVDTGGNPTADLVRQKVDWLMAEKVPLAGIAVISKTNLRYPQMVADYYISRGIAFRVLDIYQATDTLPLTREAAASFAQYQTFFKELYCLPEVQAALGRGLDIEPLTTARSMLEEWQRGYSSPLSDEARSHREWALAVNTNGDVYSPGDCYDEKLKYGNIFSQPLDDILFLSEARERRIERSAKRCQSICSNCFLYRKGCEGVYVSHATPESARDNRRHKGCHYGLLASWMRDMPASGSTQRAVRVERAAPPLSGPSREVLYLNLTYRCDSRCLFCAADVKYKEKPQNVPLASLAQLVGEKEYLRIDLSGGEPTLHPDILEIVRLCRGHAEQVAILTHGRRLRDRAFTENLLAAGGNLLVIPLYGAEASQHDYISQVKGSFRQTLEGLENLQGLAPAYRARVELKLLLTKFTAPLNRSIYHLVRERFSQAVQEISVCPLIYSQSTLDFQADFSCSFAEVKQDFFNLVEEIKADGIFALRTNEFPPCFFPSRELRALAHPGAEVRSESVVYSYVDEQSADKISMNDNAQDFRSGALGNQLVRSCNPCRYRSYCSRRPSPYFSAAYLEQFGENEFRPIMPA